MNVRNNQETPDLSAVKVDTSNVNLDSNQRESSKKLFHYYDFDKNGEISKEELKVMLSGFREAINENEVNLFFQKYDIDASEYLDFSEFLEIVKYKLVKEANNLAASKSISYHFDKEELEILVQYLDIITFTKGETLNILTESEEGTLITLAANLDGAKNGKSGLAFNSLKGKKFVAKQSGIAIKLDEAKIEQLVLNYPLIALKLNQSLDSRLSAMMAKFV